MAATLIKATLFFSSCANIINCLSRRCVYLLSSRIRYRCGSSKTRPWGRYFSRRLNEHKSIPRGRTAATAYESRLVLVRCRVSSYRVALRAVRDLRHLRLIRTRGALSFIYGARVFFFSSSLERGLSSRRAGKNCAREGNEKRLVEVARNGRDEGDNASRRGESIMIISVDDLSLACARPNCNRTLWLIA